MVKKRDLKKIVEDLTAWNETIKYPQHSLTLEQCWTYNLEQSMEKNKIQRPLEANDLARVRNATIDNFLEVNIEAIKSLLNCQVEEEVGKLLQILSISTNYQEFFGKIQEFSTEAYERLSETHRNYMGNEVILNGFSEILSSLDEKIVEACKVAKPNLFMSMDTKIRNYINERYTESDKVTTSVLGLTSKEQYTKIILLCGQESDKIASFAIESYHIFPSVLLNLYQNMIKNRITEHWMQARDEEFQRLEYNFSIFLDTILLKIQHKELAAFDKTLCNQNCREALVYIALSVLPKGIEWPNYLCDELIRVLDFDGDLDFQGIVAIKDNLDISVQKFLENTDQVCRFFTIVSLVLVISGAYSGFLFDRIERRFEAQGREWIRNILNAAFDRKYESILGIHPKMTEWSLVLITERKIVEQIPSWDVEEDVINMTDYIREEYSKKCRNFADKIEDFSEKPNRNRYLKGALSLTSKLAKSILPSKQIKEFSLELIKNVSSLSTTIVVSGWLSQEDNMWDSWAGLVNYKFQGNTYALRWDSGTERKMVKKELFSTILNTIGVIVAAPIVKVAHLTMLYRSNPFKKRAKKAETTGYVLADLIASKKLGNACVSLVGFSLGTRVIFYCLQRLIELNVKVHDVLLLGGAAPCDIKLWEDCRKVVGGRLINTYSKTDKILSRLYAISRLEKAIGNYPIEVEGIENYDVTEEASGHLMYRECLDKVLEKVEYNIK